jgi:hypothetical protein
LNYDDKKRRRRKKKKEKERKNHKGEIKSKTNCARQENNN